VRDPKPLPESGAAHVVIELRALCGFPTVHFNFILRYRLYSGSPETELDASPEPAGIVKSVDEPLLLKGNDFARTDVETA
jgi:hypothetical protein